MKMQRSTARLIYTVIGEALNASDPELIDLPDSVMALIKDVIAREELAQLIDESGK